MKKIFTVMLVLALVLFALAGCSSGTSSRSYSNQYGTNEQYQDRSGQTSGSSSTFSNEYGTATTKCAHPGCNRNVASSGDTNCCTTHSKRCLECGKYIDEDAIWCMSCLTNAIRNAQ